MDNTTNLSKYRRLAPIYDWIFLGLRSARARVWSMLLPGLKAELLLVGVGTGLDFSFLPEHVRTTGIDLSEEMLARAQQRVGNRQITLMRMNAEELRFPDQSFECAALNLILSVAGNPKQVLAETVRVLKPKGKILIWDKFARPGKIHWVRKVLNGITSGLGTDITRNLEALLQGIPVNVLENQDSLFKGNYRAVLLEKRCE